jgi:predicted regulator of Ras-like GTPase activity (Roadblock/LC7/MglB family)
MKLARGCKLALEGAIEEFNIVTLLQTVGSSRLTGNLTVQDVANKARVSFLSGKIIHAESTLGGDRIGEILVRTHRLTRPQLEQAYYIQRQAQQGRRLGSLLLEMKLITDVDLTMAVQVQIMEVLSRLITWQRGRFRFDFEPPATGALPTTALDVDEVLSGQISLLDDLDPSFDREAMLASVIALTPGQQRPPSERITVQGHEWAVLSAVDGRSTVAQIAERTGFDPDHVCQIVADLLGVGLVVRKSPEPGEPTPTRHEPVLANLYREAERDDEALAEANDSRPNPATLVMDDEEMTRIEQVLEVLLTRTESSEICLIGADGSIIARRGQALHRNYPSLFALAAGIFTSWHELGRYLGESKPSTLVYHGANINTCLSPVGQHAIIMTLYHQNSNTGLVNFWSKEAAALIARVLSQSATRTTRDEGRRSNIVTVDFRARAAEKLDTMLNDSKQEAG